MNLFDCSNNCGAIVVIMDWGSYIISIAKTKSGLLLFLQIFFRLRLLFSSINLSYGLALNTVAMSLAATWVCWISTRN